MFLPNNCYRAFIHGPIETADRLSYTLRICNVFKNESYRVFNFTDSGSSHRRFKFIHNPKHVSKVVLLRRVAHICVYRKSYAR